MTEAGAFSSIASAVGPAVAMNKYGLVSASKIKRFEDCSQIKTIVHTIGGNEKILSRIRELCGPKSYIRVSNFKQRYNMVASGRADACISSDRELDILSWFDMESDKFRFMPLDEVPIHVLVRTTSAYHQEPLRSQLSKAIERILERDGFGKARREFMMQARQKKSSPSAE
jgi:ABC-type amino acid transport substrate-binding protein